MTHSHFLLVFFCVYVVVCACVCVCYPAAPASLSASGPSGKQWQLALWLSRHQCMDPTSQKPPGIWTGSQSWNLEFFFFNKKRMSVRWTCSLGGLCARYCEVLFCSIWGWDLSLHCFLLHISGSESVFRQAGNCSRWRSHLINETHQ